MKVVRRIARFILVCIVLILTILLTASIAIQIPSVQSKVAKFALEKLNKSLNTRMYVDNVDIDFFGKIYLNKVSIKDDHNLDFITTKQLQTTLSIWSIVSNPDYINLKEVKLVEPNVKVITYKGDSISNFIRFVNGFSSDKPKDPTRTFKLDGDFYMKNGNLSILNENSGNRWINASNLQLHVENFKLVDSDINAKIENFCFKTTRNNETYNLKNFTGLFHYSKKEIRIDNLNMKTDDSTLNGHFLLSYKKPADLSDFNNKVFWNVYFDRGSVVNFKDIRYFTPIFNKNSSANVFGKVTGTLNNLNFHNFEINGGGNYIGANDLVLTDMMNNNIKIKTKNAKINSSYNNITSFLPTSIGNKIPDFIKRFGSMNYRGDFQMIPAAIDINGYAVTGLGDADIRATIKNYTTPKNLVYTGTVDAKNLNIRQITDVKDLGYVSGKIKFNGQGTDISKMKIDLDGNLRYIDLLDKRYQNITVDGIIKDYAFNGLFDIRDPNLNGQLKGNINFSGKPYKFDFSSSLRHINLDFLGITKNLNAIVKGDVQGDFSFTNLNDLNGNIDLKNLVYQSKKDTIKFDHITINSSLEGNNQQLDLNVPDYMQANIYGKYLITDIPKVITNSLAPMVPSLSYQEVAKGQEFYFDVYIQQNLLSYFDPSIKIEPNTRLNGFINSDLNTLKADLDTPGVSYAGVNLFNSKVSLNTTQEVNSLNAKADSLKVSGFTLNNIEINSIPKKDTLLLDTHFNIGKKSPVKFDLNLYHTLNDKKDNFIFGFAPSTILIDSTQWHINPNNEFNKNRVVLDPVRKSFRVQDLVLESGNQHLDITGVFYGNENYNFQANYNDLDLDKLIPKAVLGNLKLNGIANGKVDVVRTKEKLEPKLETKIEELKVNDFLLGNLTLNGGYNIADNIFNFNLSLLRENIESLIASGDIINKPTGPELNVVANLDDFEVNFLEGFLGSVFSNIRGTLSGDAIIKGPINMPDLDGKLVAKNLGMKVKFLGVDYLFEGNNELEVNKTGKYVGTINLNDIKLKDTTYGTTGFVSGSLLFKSLSEWGLNLQFDTDNLLVMNTSMNDNELFFGKIFAKGNIEMMGAVDELGIYGDATVVGNSELTINTGSTKIENESNLVRFVPDQKQIDSKVAAKAPKGMLIDLNINAYPTAKINLVFDAATNDKVSGRGTAENLRFLMNNKGLSLTGTYNIENGTYEFRQIPLIPKDFKIEKGSAVQFSGNPMDATLNIKAIFDRPVSNVGDYLGIGFSQIYETELSINISETLAKPKIEFGLELLNAGSDINSQLQSKFRSNQEEQMIQFSFILLTGKFGDALDITSGVTSTAADIGLSTIAGVMSSIINGVDVDLEYVGGSQRSGTNDKIRYSLSYQINERLKIRGAYGMAVRNQYQENFDGNLNLSYDISKLNNGSLVLNAFTKPTSFTIQQFSGGNTMINQSYGAGITYNASFNNFQEFINPNKKSNEARAKYENAIKENAQRIQDSIIPPPEDKKITKKSFDTIRHAIKIHANETRTSSNNDITNDEVKNSSRKRGLVRIK